MTTIDCTFDGESTPLKGYREAKRTPAGTPDVKRNLVSLLVGIMIGCSLSNYHSTVNTRRMKNLTMKADLLNLRQASTGGCIDLDANGMCPNNITPVGNVCATVSEGDKPICSAKKQSTTESTTDIYKVKIGKPPPTMCTHEQEARNVTCDANEESGEGSCASEYTNSSALCVPQRKCGIGFHLQGPPPSWWPTCVDNFPPGGGTSPAGCGTCKKPNVSQGQQKCMCAGLQNVACSLSDHYPGYYASKLHCPPKPCSSAAAAAKANCVAHDLGHFCADKGHGKCAMQKCPVGTSYSQYSQESPSFVACSPKFYSLDAVTCPIGGTCAHTMNLGSEGAPPVMADQKVPRGINKYCDVMCMCGIKKNDSSDRYGPPKCQPSFSSHQSGQNQSSDDGKGILEGCYCDKNANDGRGGIALDHTKFDDCGQYMPLYGPDVGGGQAGAYSAYAKSNGLIDYFPEPKPICVKDD